MSARELLCGECAALDCKKGVCNKYKVQLKKEGFNDWEKHYVCRNPGGLNGSGKN